MPISIARYNIARDAIKLALVCWGGVATVVGAEQLRFDARQDWAVWPLPLGNIEFTASGAIKPVRVEQDINAVLNASDFGGGIHSASSNASDARLAIDGDPTTGWSPDADAGLAGGVLEIDLGRGVSSRRVTLLFDKQAPPFELFELLLSTGEQFIDEVGNPIDGTLAYRIVERYKENKRHRIVFQLDQPEHSPIQYVRFASFKTIAGARLMEVQVDALGDNIALGALERGGKLDVVLDAFSVKETEALALGTTRVVLDGDLVTWWQVRRATQATQDVFSQLQLDLGATYWVDRVKIIGGVVVRGGFAGGITTSYYITRRSFSFNFYEVLTSDGSLAPDGSLIWIKHFSGTATDYNRQVSGLADHRFDLVPTRHVRILWKSWDNATRRSYRARAEELQIFGRGHPQAVVFRSPLIDLQDIKNINSIEWLADAPAGTRVEIRTRSGNELAETLSFHDKNGKEVTAQRYEKLIPSFRGAIDTTRVAGVDWSAWSRIYSASGQEFQSPSPRKRVQFEVRMISEDPEQAAELQMVAVNFSETLARSAFSEISPLQVSPGEENEFRIYLKPTEIRRTGFDRVFVEAPVPMRFVRAMSNGEPADVVSEDTDAGFQVTFARAIADGDLLELRFSARIFQQSTQFNLFIQDSRDGGGLRQKVDAGDATEQVASGVNVVALPVVRNLLIDKVSQALVLSPNSDGVNERLELALDVVNVALPRPLRLGVFNLSGRLVYEAMREVVAGPQLLSWDGRDLGGRLVPPGIYLLHFQINGDARRQSLQHIASVVY